MGGDCRYGVGWNKKLTFEEDMDMAANSDYNFEETMVTLTDEDGLDRDVYIDEIYEVEGRMYASAIPADQENVTEYYVFRVTDLGNDDFELDDITDEDEYDRAADYYEELLDTRAWNQINKQD